MIPYAEPLIPYKKSWHVIKIVLLAVSPAQGGLDSRFGLLQSVIAKSGAFRRLN
jgi:hypothetical protein